MMCPRCSQVITHNRHFNLTVICKCGWSNNHQTKLATEMTKDQIKNVFLMLTAIAALGCAYKIKTIQSSRRQIQAQAQNQYQRLEAISSRQPASVLAGEHQEAHGSSLPSGVH